MIGKYPQTFSNAISISVVESCSWNSRSGAFPAIHVGRLNKEGLAWRLKQTIPASAVSPADDDTIAMFNTQCVKNSTCVFILCVFLLHEC